MKFNETDLMYLAELEVLAEKPSADLSSEDIDRLYAGVSWQEKQFGRTIKFYGAKTAQAVTEMQNRVKRNSVVLKAKATADLQNHVDGIDQALIFLLKPVDEE